MLSMIIEKAKTMFISEKERKIVENTKAQHLESQNVLFRSLDEITLKYYLTSIYNMNEVYANEDSQNVAYYEFHDIDYQDDKRLRVKYYDNEGMLILVDEEIKEKINKRFRFKVNYDVYFDKPNLSSTLDFIYKYDNQSYWVTLKPIRTEEQEEKHTEMLELLYSALYNAKEIDIDVNFLINNCTNEKYYDLVHFRLDRNSLFLVVKDKEDNKKYHSLEFKNIQHINFSNIEDRLKFWLYMFDGTYRFYIPYDINQLNGGHVRIDPLIYK